ncbi:LuxR family transcriptional regulator [Mesorhizobium sp. J8]|uniref:LuxR family transcriptional regulator n=1 Tax=Mesorhizobium sp. J8 TaxID=2777475 RepID=UPI00191677E4|nr:LuxR family transcriptional regulator [Mesorhizobium sp. J8]BCM17635.1 LuxR family transcriptional regulator [Mesorhizobium sp. J8]
MPTDHSVSQLRGLTRRVSDWFSFMATMQFQKAAREAFAVEFGQFLDRIDGTTEPKQLFDLLCAFALNLDCPWTAYGPLAPDPNFLKPFQRDLAVMLNYPNGWQKRCFEMGYDRIDPIIKALRRQAGAFQWSDMYCDASTTEHERRVLDEAAAFGLRSGISVPLHGPDGSAWVVSFAQSEGLKFQNKMITYLQVAAFHFHLRVSKCSNWSDIQEIPNLTPREKECILWTARGKSSWEIGQILEISVNTVNFHIKNVKEKLNASSRTVAAIRAINVGVVEL